MKSPNSDAIWKFPLGIDNRSRETALPDGALRSCENMDITTQGTLMTRRGLQPVLASACHSLYALPAGLLLVQNGYLSRLDGGGLTALQAVNTVAPMHYAELHGDVYFTNGQEQGRVRAEGSVASWGLSVPPAPRVTVGQGHYRAGVVRVTQTAVVDGLESGAPEPVAVSVPDNSGVQVTVPTGATFNVYATEVDGDVFRLAGTATEGGTVALNGPIAGRPLESLLAIKPPPGQALAAFKGRLWIAVGDILFFSSNLSPHWVFPATDYWLFDAPITRLVPVEDGLFVGTERTVHFLAGTDPGQMSQRTIAHAGVMAGTEHIPTDLQFADGLPMAMSCALLLTDGFLYLGRPGGVLQPLVKARFCFGSATNGHMTYSERDSTRQLVVVLDEPTLPGAIDAPVAAVYNGSSP